MTRDMFERAVGKIPAVVEQMARYYNENECEDDDDWIETVHEFWPFGTERCKSVFELGPYTVKKHLMQAVRMGLDVSGDKDQGFTVKRTLKNGSYYIVTYCRKTA